MSEPALSFGGSTADEEVATATKTVAFSAAQRELFAACRQDERAALAFLEASAVQLAGSVDQQALADAVQDVITRHDALRASVLSDGSGFSVAAPGNHPGLQMMAPGCAWESWLTDELSRPITWQSSSLVRFHFQPAATGGTLVLIAHQLVCDDASRETILRELAESYTSRCTGREWQRTPAPQLATLLEQEEIVRASPDFPGARKFWEEVWRSLPETAPELPADFPRPARPSFTGAICRHEVPREVVDALRAAGREHELTPFTLLLAGFAVLIQRLTDTEQFALGVPVSGQRLSGTEALVAHATRLLPLMLRGPAEFSFLENARSIQATLGRALEHAAAIPVPPPPDARVSLHPARPWPFGMFFSVTHAREELSFGEARGEQVPVPHPHLFGELAWRVTETEHALTIEARFNRDLFSPETIARWLRHYTTLLTAIPGGMSTPLTRLPLLTPEERHQLLGCWTSAKPMLAYDALLHRGFEVQVARRAAHDAVVAADATLDYRTLDARANQLAHHLLTHGAQPGRCIALLVSRSSAYAIGALGILKSGAAFVPIDPEWPAERQAFVLRHCAAQVLVTTSAVRTAVHADGIPLVDLEADQAQLTALPTSAPSSPVAPEDPAYVIYTSGSTGEPKGVIISHRAAATHMAGIIREFRLGPDDRSLLFHSVAFDPAVEQLFAPLTAGATVVMRRDELWSGHEFAAFVRDHGLTAATLSPHYWLQLLREWAQEPRLAPVGQLRRVLVGGEALPYAAVQLWRDLGLTSIRLLNGYGPTECTITATLYDVPAQPGPAEAHGTVPLGRPQGPVEACVLDAHLEPQPLGVPGELCLSGPTLATGYLGRDELTRERFVPHPFRPGQRLYRTGDRVRIHPSGTLEFLGRSDRQIKIAGYRVEPGEVEAWFGRLPGIQACAVVPETRSDGTVQLAAYYVPDAGTAPGPGQLRAAAREHLPGYLVPTRITAVPYLPQTLNGKLDMAALATLGTGPDANDSDEGLAPPTSELEEILHEIWCGVLGRERCGIHEHFFALGGTSLAAMRIVARTREALALEIPTRCVFDHPTIARMACAVEPLLLADLASADTACPATGGS